MKTQVKLLAAVLLCSVFLVQCKKESVQEIVDDISATASDIVTDEDSSSVDSVAKVEVENVVPIIPKISTDYSRFIFPKNKKDSAMAVFRKQYTKEQRYMILALNRLDEKNAWRADTLMIPNNLDADFVSYSPFPSRLEILKDVNKFVTFSYPIQAYAVYENGSLVKWGPTSMGKKASQTKRGLMFANWKKELAISTVNKNWKLPYNFNIHNSLGIGWHQYDLPGFPQSHSCLRLLMDDAKWMYKFADPWILNKGGVTTKAKGTPVVVFGDYKWGGRKPWKKLAEDPKANDYTVEQMDEIIQPYLEEILNEQKNRKGVIAAQPSALEVVADSTIMVQDY